MKIYFIKRILTIPNFTPKYATLLETTAEESHFYTFGLHMKHIFKTFYEYKESRLPHIKKQDIFCYKHLKEMASEFGLKLDEFSNSMQWHRLCIQLLTESKANTPEIIAKRRSHKYKYLDQTKWECELKISQ